jgi:hypothetical protein
MGARYSGASGFVLGVLGVNVGGEVASWNMFGHVEAEVSVNVL